MFFYDQELMFVIGVSIHEADLLKATQVAFYILPF
jgi:hypothetical protein